MINIGTGPMKVPPNLQRWFLTRECKVTATRNNEPVKAVASYYHAHLLGTEAYMTRYRDKAECRDVPGADWPAHVAAFATSVGISDCAGAVPALASMGVDCGTDLSALGDASFEGYNAGQLCGATCGLCREALDLNSAPRWYYDDQAILHYKARYKHFAEHFHTHWG